MPRSIKPETDAMASCPVSRVSESLHPAYEEGSPESLLKGAGHARRAAPDRGRAGAHAAGLLGRARFLQRDVFFVAPPRRRSDGRVRPGQRVVLAPRSE